MAIDQVAVNPSSIGKLHVIGTRGYSAYEVAVLNGFVGTEEEWLASLKGDEGDPGPQGKSAYEVAVDNGFIGTEEEWVNSFLNADNYYNKNAVDDKIEEITTVIDDMYLSTQYDYQTKELVISIVKDEGE